MRWGGKIIVLRALSLRTTLSHLYLRMRVRLRLLPAVQLDDP